MLAIHSIRYPNYPGQLHEQEDIIVKIAREVSKARGSHIWGLGVDVQNMRQMLKEGKKKVILEFMLHVEVFNPSQRLCLLSFQTSA